MSWEQVKQLQEKKASILTEANEIMGSENITPEQRTKANELLTKAENINEEIALHQRSQSLTEETKVEPVMEQRDVSKYSLLRAIRCYEQHKPLDGLEKEVSDEIARRSGKEAKGFYVPMNALLTRDVTTTTGAGVVGEEISSDFVGVLRNRSLAGKLGARFMGGLVGDVAIPKITTGSTAYWISTEGSMPTESNPAIGQVSLSPNTLGATIDVTRTLSKQTSGSADKMLQEDMVQALAAKLDTAVFSGSGSSGEPEGLLNNGSIGSVAIGTNGGAPTWAKVVELEEAVATANADFGSLHYVTSPKGFSKLQTTEKVSSTAAFLLEDGMMNGYACHRTTAIGTDYDKGSSTDTLTALYFGNWNDCVIASWGNIDVTVNPYTNANMTSITVLHDCDIKFRNDASFAACLDLEY